MKAPGFGDRRKAMLEDIAPHWWSIDHQTRLKLDNTKLDMLGVKDYDHQGQHYDCC